MRTLTLLMAVTGFAAVLIGGTPGRADDRRLVSNCMFCFPGLATVEPRYQSTPYSAQSYGRETYAGSRYSRFDVEGLRLMTRMP